MIYPGKYLLLRNCTIKIYCIPVLFIHVITWCYRTVFFSQFKCKCGIAFKVNAWVAVQVDKGKDLSPCLEDQCILTEWKTFGDVFFLQAIFTEDLGIHKAKVDQCAYLSVE